MGSDFAEINAAHVRVRGNLVNGSFCEHSALVHDRDALGDITHESDVMLDEPSDGVQPSIVHEIGNFIVRLVASRPLGVLIVEQNIELMQRAAERAYVMDKGRVVAALGKEQLLNTELLTSYLAV